MSLGRDAFQLAFQISPILLVGGIATLTPGGILPIVVLTEAANFTESILSGEMPPLDRFLCHWSPQPGSTLVSNLIAAYPFANQSIAANAVLKQPLVLSMLMSCPVQTAGGYAAKLATITVLQGALQQHINAGGTFTVATPSALYPNCILMNVRDVSNANSKQPQNAYMFDFIQPLVTLSAAQQVYGNLMDKIANGLPTSLEPSWSGNLVSPVLAALPSPTFGVGGVPQLGS